MAQDKSFAVRKFRIYPTAVQKSLIWKTFGCKRWYWNKALAACLKANLNFIALCDKAKEEGTTLKVDKDFVNKLIAESVKEILSDDSLELADADPKRFKFWCGSPALFKAEVEFLKEIDSMALCNVWMDLKQSCSMLFPKGKVPEFCAKSKQKRTYTTNFINNNIAIESVSATENYLKLPKLGRVKVIVHRDLPENGKFKHVTVSETASGKFYVAICFEVPYQEVKPLTKFENVEAFDFSLPTFAVSASAEHDIAVEAIHWYRNMEPKLAREQRKLSHMQYGSKNYWKQRHKVGAIHEKIANRRKDFLQKLSKVVAEQFDAVGVEDLNLVAMAQTLNFGKSVNDLGFGMFRLFLAYKLKALGKYLVKVARNFPSSQRCSVCGAINPELKNLRVREWTCPQCHTHHNRDKNAAENIRQEALRMLNRWASGDSSLEVDSQGVLRAKPQKQSKRVKKTLQLSAQAGSNEKMVSSSSSGATPNKSQ